jgi:gliding motility-associated-like protein
MKRLLLAFLLLLSTFVAPAQGTTGTEFWCGFMENLTLAFNGPPTFVFQIDAPVTTNGVVEVPATGLSIPFVANGGMITEVTLPAATWYSEGSEFIDTKGIRITTDDPVNITAVHYRLYFTDATRLLATSELGVEYYPTCYPDQGASSPTTFVIVGTADDTEIEITPTTLTQGLKPAGVPFTITLDEGESYQVKAAGDLSGTHILSLSGQKIAVFSGAQQGNVGPCLGAADSHIYDQAVPLSEWEDTYLFVPFSGQGSDPVHILAAEDNTTIYFDCQPVAMLDVGDVFISDLGSPTVITGDGPISVAQFNSSQDCNPSGVGDPNMLQLFPASKQLNSIRFLVSNGPGSQQYLSAHFVNLVVETAGVPNLLLDGGPLGSFTPFPANPSYSYAQVPLTAGEHEIVSVSPFWGTRYSFGDFDAYTANLGYVESNEVLVQCLDIEVDGLFCVDSLLTFSAFSSNEIDNYAWDFGDTQTSDVADPEISYSAAGVYMVQLTVTYQDGSTASTSLEIEIFDCPEEPCDDQEYSILAVGDPCEGIVFGIDPPGDFIEYEWDFGNFDGSGEATPEYVYVNEGTYLVTVVLTDAFNCIYSASLEVEVPDCSDPCQGSGDVEIFLEGTPCVDSLLIFYTSVTFDPDAPPIFQDWSFSNGDFFSFQDTVQLTFDQAGEYVVEFSAFDFPFCDYFGVLEFEIFDDCDDPCINQPDLSILPNGEFCIDSVLTFSTQTTATLVDYFWEFSNGDTSTDPVVQQSFPSEDVYGVQLTATDVNGCIYFEEFLFDIAPCDPCEDPFEVILDSYGLYCVGEEITFSFLTSTTLANLNWDFGDNSNSTDLQPVHVYAEPGTYEVTMSGLTANGCPYEASLELLIEDCLDPCLVLYEAEIQYEGVLCRDSVLVLTAGGDVPDPVTFDWFTLDGFTLTGEQVEYTVPDEEDINIQLLITDVNGCVWEDILLEPIENCIDLDECEVFFPNAFSPNFDGENDYFGPLTQCPLEDFELLIFNRWGDLVFRSTDPDFTWDGNFNGQAATQDVYVWKAVFSLQGEMWEEYGDITLLR